MSKAVTTRENILAESRNLVLRRGLAAVNMRSVAEACGVALGSIYYYFPSKDDLLIATIESVWDDIFSGDDSEEAQSFPEFVEDWFYHVQKGIDKYPNFFTIHSVSFSTQGQQKGYSTMQDYLSSIREKLLVALEKDDQVSPRAFTADFPKEGFVEVALMALISLFMQKQTDCSLLVEMVKRTIYLP